MKKKKRKMKKGLVVIVVVIILFICGVFVFKKVFNKKPVPTPVVEVVDTIDNFDYELNDNETKYYNELFNELKDLLSKEDYSEEEYAVLIGKLFLADFYDLDSKVMKSDVGGTQFVYSEYRTDFEKGATASVYKFVESNVYGDRKQDLPVIKSVEKISLDTTSYKSDMISDQKAYKLEMSITYNKDLGYPTDVILVLVHNEGKLEIVSMDTK